MLLLGVGLLAGAVGGYMLRVLIDRNAAKVAAMEAMTGVTVPTLPKPPAPGGK